MSPHLGTVGQGRQGLRGQPEGLAPSTGHTLASGHLSGASEASATAAVDWAWASPQGASSGSSGGWENCIGPWEGTEGSLGTGGGTTATDSHRVVMLGFRSCLATLIM
jgi:hypothetical protein